MGENNANRDWFDRPDPDTGERGLRFSCTMCGNCCSGPPGVVLFSPQEADAIAASLGISTERFIADYTEPTPRGRSIRERETPHGLDCVFLDRESQPGRALCSIYHDRPSQCRTWPFWPHLLRSRDDWIRAKRTCPGLDTGRLYPPEEIRIIRDNRPTE